MKHIFFDLDRTLWDFEKNSHITLLQLISHFNLTEKGIDNPVAIDAGMNMKLGDVAQMSQKKAKAFVQGILKPMKDDAYNALDMGGKLSKKNILGRATQRLHLDAGKSGDEFSESTTKVLKKLEDELNKRAKGSEFIKATHVRGILDWINEKAFRATSKKRPKSEIANYRKVHHEIGEMMNDEFEAVGYTDQWNKLKQLSEIVDPILTRKADDKDWATYIKRIYKEASDEIKSGEDINVAFKQLQEFDNVAGTSFAQDLEQKALYQQIAPESGQNLLQVAQKGAGQGYVNLRQMGKRGTEKVGRGVTNIAKKVFGTKWQKPLEEALKNDGIKGMTAVHMMLMATDRAYREKHRKE